MSTILSQSDFNRIAEEIGICHPQLSGGIRIPGDMSLDAKNRLSAIYDKSQYIQSRVSEAVAGGILVHLVGGTGRLSTIEEDLCDGFDYEIRRSDESLKIDFTRGDKGYETKKLDGKKSQIQIIQVDGSILLSFIGYIAARRHNQGFKETIDRLVREKGRSEIQGLFVDRSEKL